MKPLRYRSFLSTIFLLLPLLLTASVFADVTSWDISTYPKNVQEQLQKAQNAFKAENYQQALDLYRSLTKEEPELLAAFIGQGDSFAKLGDYTEAISIYQQSLRLISASTQPERFAYQPFVEAKLATAYHRNKQLEKAEELFQSAVKGAGANTPVTWYIALAQIETERNNLEKARRYYIVAVQLYPDNTATYSNLGHVLLKLNRLDEADAVFRHALILDSTLGRAAFGRGEVAAKRGNFTLARQYYENAIQSTPNEPIFHKSLAEILTIMGDVQGAESTNRRYKQILAEVYRQQALPFMKNRQGIPALELLKKSIETDETYLPALKDYAYVQMQLDNLDIAKQTYQKVLNREPNSVQALLHLGMIESRRGNRNVAESYFQTLINNEPEFMDTYYQLSKLRETSGDLKGAENALTSGIQKNPSWAPGYLWRGHIYLKRDLTHKAETDYRQAIKHAPNVPFPKHALASLLAKENRLLNEALRFSEAAVAIDPRPTHIATRAYVYFRLNRLTEAKREISKAYVLSPKSPYVLHIRTEILNPDLK